MDFGTIKEFAGSVVKWIKNLKKKKADLAARICRDVLLPLRNDTNILVSRLDGRLPVYAAYNESSYLSDPLRSLRTKSDIAFQAFADQQGPLLREVNDLGAVLKQVAYAATKLLRALKADQNYRAKFRAVLDNYLGGANASDQDRNSLVPANTERKINEVFDIIANAGDCEDGHICYGLWASKGKDLSALVQDGPQQKLWRLYVGKRKRAKLLATQLSRKLKAIEVALYKEGLLDVKREGNQVEDDETEMTIL